MVLNALEVAFVRFIFCSLASHSAITNFRYLHGCTSVWSCSGGVCLCISTSTKTGKCSSNNQCWDESLFWRRYRHYKGSKHFLWRCCLNNSLCKTNLLGTYWKVKFLCLVCVSEQMDFESLPWDTKVQKDFICLTDALYVQVNDQALMMNFQDCYILEFACEVQLQYELCREIREISCEIGGWGIHQLVVHLNPSIGKLLCIPYIW